MPPPTRRVLAIPKTARLGPIEHRLDPPAHSHSGFGLSCPQRLDCLHHHAYVDLAHWHRSKLRRYVGGERVLPLLPMFGVAPSYRVGLYVGAGTIVECHRACGFNFLGGVLSLAALEWIDLVGEERALRRRFLPYIA